MPRSRVQLSDPGAARPAPIPNPRAGAPDFPSFRSPDSAPGFFFVGVDRVWTPASARLVPGPCRGGGSIGRRRGDASTARCRSKPKEERAGTDQRGDADGEDRLLHGDINLNGSHSVPVGAWPRSRGTALDAAALRAERRRRGVLCCERSPRCPSWNSRNLRSDEAAPWGVRSTRVWGKVTGCYKSGLRQTSDCAPCFLARGLGQTAPYERCEVR